MMSAFISFLIKLLIPKALHILNIMYDWIKSNDFFDRNQAISLLDNCAVHKINLVKSCIEKMNCSKFYISQYSLSFALIEMCFGLIKRNLAERCKGENAKLPFRHSHANYFTVKHR